jgi:hypothetical protein
MPVSYLSTPVKSNPYVLPVDLDLMSKVLQYKDQQFKQNEQQLQQTVNNFAGLDVMKPEDRKYLNDKINSMVSNLKGMGNVDLGDPNVAAQMESFASNVYGDPKITAAVTGTQQVRKLQQEYDQYKNNPKMKGMFGVSNYAKDMTAAQQWLGDGSVGSTYNGPSSATPYKDVDKQAASIAKDIKANEYTYDERNGLYIDRTSGQSKTEEQIQQIVAQRLMNDPDYRQQVQTNAWYLTEGSGITGKDIIDHNSQLLQGQVDDLTTNLQKNQALLVQAASSPEEKAKYSANIASLKDQISKIQSQKKDLDENGLKNYENNPGGYQTNYYLNNFTKGIAATYAFQKQTHELRPDQATMFQYRYGQEEDKMDLTAAIHGLQRVYDPSTGRHTLIPLEGVTPKGAQPPLINTGIAAPNRIGDLSKISETPEKTSQNISDLEGAKYNTLLNYIRDYSNLNPNLNLIDANGKIAGQDELTAMGKARGFGDQFNIKDLSLAGTLAKLSDGQSKFLQSLFENYNAKAEGKKVDVRKFPIGFDEMYTTVSELNNQIDTKKQMLTEANSILPLNANEKSLWSDYQVSPAKYKHQETAYIPGNEYSPGSSETFTVDSPEIQKIKTKLDALPQDQKNAYWDNISRRFQYGIFAEPDIAKNPKMMALLKTAHDNGSVIGEKVADTFSDADVKGVAYHKNEDPTTANQYPYIADVTLAAGTGKNKHDAIEQIGLTPQISSFRGLSNPDAQAQAVDYETRVLPRSKPRIVSDPEGLLSVKVEVARIHKSDPNDNSSIAFVLIPDQSQPDGYDRVQLGGVQNSAADAFTLAKNTVSAYPSLAKQQGIDPSDFQTFAKYLNTSQSR